MGRAKRESRNLTQDKVMSMMRSLFWGDPLRPHTFKDIFKSLKLNTHPSRMLAMEAIDKLESDGFLVKVSDDAYKLNIESQAMEGKFIRKANGNNKFVPDNGSGPIFVDEAYTLAALSGDRVKAVVLPYGLDDGARIIKITQRAKNTFVGKLRVKPKFAIFDPDEENFPYQKVIVPNGKLKGGATGDKVVVKITRWPKNDNDNFEAEVVDILGKPGDNDVEMNSILVQYGLPYKYPKRVEEAANKITGEITEQDYREREDFRDVTTFTIDPKDAKDFDDALSIREIGKGLWEVGVHIADVSHYVIEGSIIDKEAQKRATSIYLVDRTIPMLPERLCNFVCSLRPDEEKLTYSAIFEIDAEGVVSNYRLSHTIIKSNRRFAYEEVQEILEKNGVQDGTGEPAPPPGKDGYKGEFANELITLDRIAKSLRSSRFKAGSVKFDREELRFEIDETGKPLSCYYKKSKDANKLIEEFMLLANKYVAESIGKVKKGQKPKTLPYRIHEEPDPSKLATLGSFVKKFGYKLKTSGRRSEISKSLNSLMDSCNGKNEQKIIEMVALRAMMKAKYSIYNIGHYGLAFDYYTHFTSPIRRYPDTMVHRLLTRYEQGFRSASKQYYEEQCEHSSDMEQIAQNAERDSIKYKMVEFMGDKIGEKFPAHISGITSYGIYCEIDENHCEGLVRFDELFDDYYDFDERNYCLVGRRSNYKYSLGDAVEIKVESADLQRRQLNFSLVKRKKR